MSTMPEFLLERVGEPLPRPTLADLITAYLEQLGVEYVFGVPGGAIEAFYDALARSSRRGGPRPVTARHEAGAAFMAQGYAHETGKLGVCCATTGPGATNLITAVASAYAEAVPLLVITAQTPLPTFGRGAFQESSCTAVNTVGMFDHCARYNSLVSHPEQLEGKLISAVMSAHQAPCGPAHLSVPLDVMRSPSPIATPNFPLAEMVRAPSLYDEDAVAHLVELLARARNPVLLLGSGCGEAAQEILELAVHLNAPMVATPQGKTWVSPYHPLFRGIFGFAGHETARELLVDPTVDLILAIGTGLGEWSTLGWERASLMNRRMVHVHSSDNYLSRSPMAQLHVRGRLLTIFEHVIAELAGPAASRVRPLRAASVVGSRHTALRIPHAELRDTADPARRFALDDEEKYLDDSAPIKPQRLMRELTRLFPANTRFLADVGNSFAWATHYLHPRATGTYRSDMAWGAMTWAIGNAVGVAMGSPQTPVVCITGDGSLLMGGQELTVAVAEGLPVIFVVLNDGAYGMVKHGQRLRGAEQVAYELPATDFAMMAQAMGSDAYAIRSPQDLLELDIEQICRRRGPTLLDVHVDPEEVPPLRARVNVLEFPGEKTKAVGT